MLGMAWSRQSQRQLLLLLLLLGSLLLYVSFGATKRLVSNLPLVKLGSIRAEHKENTDNPATEAKKEGKIILLTYGRSGSSFTSDIIQRHPDVFYTFEPLYNLIRRHLGKAPGRKQFKVSNFTREDYDRESISIMEVFLTCSFEAMNSEDINNYQLRNSDDSRLLWGCAQRRYNFTPVDVMGCFIKARKTCSSRPVKMVKTIRFRGTAAAQMMAKHDDLKILFLVRDPRGTITSQRRVFRNFDRAQHLNFSAEFCQVSREDLADLEPLFDKYPDRMKLLRYETLAENPMNVSQELYRFLGLEFTDDVREYVFNLTSAGLRSKSAYGTARPNSTQAAYKWRNLITLNEAQIIDKTCEDIYTKLGYLPLNSVKELIDLNHTLKTNIVFHGRDV